MAFLAPLLGKAALSFAPVAANVLAEKLGPQLSTIALDLGKEAAQKGLKGTANALISRLGKKAFSHEGRKELLQGAGMVNDLLRRYGVADFQKQLGILSKVNKGLKPIMQGE